MSRKKKKEICTEKLNGTECKQKLVHQECPGVDKGYCLSIHTREEHGIPTAPECMKEYGKKACGSSVGTQKCPGIFAKICLSKAYNGLYWGMPVYEPLSKGKFPRRARTKKTKRTGRRPRPRP